MQFNEQQIHQLRDACVAYQRSAGSSFIIREYDILINKIDKYKQEYECDDCIRCEIHV